MRISLRLFVAWDSLALEARLVLRVRAEARLGYRGRAFHLDG